ncbi:MAG: DUF4388 domain-containing protein [Myxococcota bacterium]
MTRAKRILIAQSEPRAGRELKTALEGRGYATRFTTSTVKALEFCVRNRPDLVIVSDDLPVIDGRTLVDILRTNPNTRDTLCIFLVPDPRYFVTAAGFQEDAIKRPSPPDAAVAAVDRMFRRAERVARMAQEPGLLKQGDVGEVPLLEVLAALHRSGQTGTLFIEKAGALRGVEQAFVYLKDGEAINALLGQIEGEKALYRILGSREGRFEFMADQAVTEWRIRRPLPLLLEEAARQIDQRRRLEKILPDAKARLRLRAKVASLPPGVHPLTQEILLLLEYHSRVEEVIDNCSAPDYQVLRTLHTLIQKGIVEVVSKGAGAAAEGPAAYQWVSDPQLARLREKIAPGGPRRGKTCGRVLVFYPDAALRQALLAVMADLPGFTLAEKGKDKAGPPEGEAFPVLGEWHIADDLSLRLLDTPIDELQRPLWSLLSRGAVGGLFLLNGARSDWIDALRPASDFFQAVSPMSIGYLILGEEPVQMELKAKLVSTFTLKGDNALFMLPGRRPERLRVILKRFLDQIISHT